MPAAVLFDWGETLFHCDYDDALHLAGWSAGLEALGDRSLDRAASARLFRERYRPLIEAADEVEADYERLVREALTELGVVTDETGLRRFIEGEHAVETAARRWVPGGFELLDRLRELGLRVGIVSNACDPGWLLERDLRQSGLARHVDAAVFSSVVGTRKPFAPIFLAALDALDAAAESTLFVGDRRRDDVQGAADVGMTTVLATWFRNEPDAGGPAPDHVAPTPGHVLEIARAFRTAHG